jgi:DNA invertase Pin-like site-specific DNA recombinase
MSRPAYGYLRTSSAANIGDDKHSERRQRDAIEAYARSAGFRIVAWFRDPAVSGADPVTDRPGFVDLLAAIAGDGVRSVIVESPDRFARDLMVQMVAHDHLHGLGVELIPASAPGFFVEDTPTATMVRQILGAVSQFEKAQLVARLRAARDRKKALTGKGSGRKSHAEARPDVVALARRLRRKPPGGKRPSLRAISATLAAGGHLNGNGRPFSARAVASMIAR